MAYIFCINLTFSLATIISLATTSADCAERPEGYKKGSENSRRNPLTPSVRYRSAAEVVEQMRKNLARNIQDAKPCLSPVTKMKPLTKGESEEEKNMRLAQEQSLKELDERRFKLSQAEVYSSEDDIENDEDLSDKTSNYEADSDIGRLSISKSCGLVSPEKEKQEASSNPKKSRRFKDLDIDYQELLKQVCREHVQGLQDSYIKFNYSLGGLLRKIKTTETELDEERIVAKKACEIGLENIEYTVGSKEAEAFQIRHFEKIAALVRMKDECSILLECFQNDQLVLVQIDEFVAQTLRDADIVEVSEVANLLSILGYGSNSNRLPKKEGAQT